MQRFSDKEVSMLGNRGGGTKVERLSTLSDHFSLLLNKDFVNTKLSDIPVFFQKYPVLSM
jgi:hypothetical protein